MTATAAPATTAHVFVGSTEDITIASLIALDGSHIVDIDISGEDLEDALLDAGWELTDTLDPTFPVDSLPVETARRIAA